MKRKRYERLHGKWEYRKPIPLRSMKELNEDIEWCRGVLESRDGYVYFIKDYLAQLLHERTKRFK